jgi:hypothetical protein
MAGKAAVKEEEAADAVKKDKKAKTTSPAQPSALMEESAESGSDVDNITAKLKEIVKHINGKIQSVEYDHKTGHPNFVSALIPADSYAVFYGELKKMGVLHGPLPAVDEKKKEMVKIRLVISK